MNWKQFKYITSYEKSLEVATRKDEIKLVLSSSGMFSNGRILNHLCKFVENPKCTIVLCGYQAEGCIGHELMREDINVFLILHSEDVQSDKTTISYKVSTIGQLLDSQYNPVEVVPMVLYSSVKYDDKGIASYGFYTHRFMDGVIEIPAKSPADMFEEDFIPNDLGYVVNKMNEYYNG